MGDLTIADVKERKYVSPFSTGGVGLTVIKGGVLGDADGDVLASLTSDDDDSVVFTDQPATHVSTGTYLLATTPQQTAQAGNYTVTWSYHVYGVPQSYEAYLQIGRPNPAYDSLPDTMKDIVELTWIRFADLFDSPGGGPNLVTYFQTHYGRGRLAELLRIAVGTLNTVAQPWSTFTVDGQGGAEFPVAQWGALLERSLYVEAIKHLIRSYVEQPTVMTGDSVARLDRRDYMQRWQAVLDDEQGLLKSQLDTFKISQMGLGKSAVLVSGGVFGRYGPTRIAGSAAARPRMWARWF